jgi:hypothetical protein
LAMMIGFTSVFVTAWHSTQATAKWDTDVRDT